MVPPQKNCSLGCNTMMDRHQCCIVRSYRGDDKNGVMKKICERKHNYKNGLNRTTLCRLALNRLPQRFNHIWKDLTKSKEKKCTVSSWSCPPHVVQRRSRAWAARWVGLHDSQARKALCCSCSQKGQRCCFWILERLMVMATKMEMAMETKMRRRRIVISCDWNWRRRRRKIYKKLKDISVLNHVRNHLHFTGMGAVSIRINQNQSVRWKNLLIIACLPSSSSSAADYAAFIPEEP